MSKKELEYIDELHKNRRWISWDEEGWLISRVKDLEAELERVEHKRAGPEKLLARNMADNKRLREAIEKHKNVIIQLCAKDMPLPTVHAELYAVLEQKTST